MSMFGSAFKQGGVGRSVLGNIGDALAQLGGIGPVYGPAIERQREDALRQQQLAEAQARFNRPQAVNLGNGGFGSWTSDGGLNVIREPVQEAPKISDFEQRINLYKRYNPAATDADIAAIVRQGIGGYQYSQPYMQQREQSQMAVADHRAAQSAALKAQPTYAQAHPSVASSSSTRVSATARARYINEAEAAIARGAPRAAVYDRLRKMGVQ